MTLTLGNLGDGVFGGIQGLGCDCSELNADGTCYDPEPCISGAIPPTPAPPATTYIGPPVLPPAGGCATGLVLDPASGWCVIPSMVGTVGGPAKSACPLGTIQDDAGHCVAPACPAGYVAGGGGGCVLASPAAATGMSSTTILILAVAGFGLVAMMMSKR